MNYQEELLCLQQFNAIYKFWTGDWESEDYLNKDQEYWARTLQYFYNAMNYTSKLYIRQYYSTLPVTFKYDDNLLMAAL